MIAKYLLIAAIVLGIPGLLFFAVGLYWGLQNSRQAVIAELEETSKALMELNQSYEITGIPKRTPEELAARKSAMLEELKLSEATTKALRAAGLKTIGEVEAKSPEEIRQIEGIDNAAATAIESSLVIAGYPRPASGLGPSPIP